MPTETFLGVRWIDWFTMAALLLTLGGFMFFLIFSFLRHRMDDPDCSKYEVFTSDSDIRPEEQPAQPVSCQPRYLKKRSWFDPVNQGWLWVTVGIGVLWGAVMIGVYLMSYVFPQLQRVTPQ